MDDASEREKAGGQSQSAREQRERRIQALRDLARQQLGSSYVPLGRPQPPAHRWSRRRLGPATLSVVLLVAIIATIIWRVTRPPTTSDADSTLPVVTITPFTDGILCPIGVAWSPDATRVAVLGYTRGCPNLSSARGANSGIVNIYDARRGRLVMSFQPDSIILNGHGVSLPSATPSPELGPFTPFLRYDDIIWSADSRQLALPFFVETGFYQQIPPYAPYFNLGNPPPPAPTLAGVLLTNASNGGQHVVSATYHDTGARLEWDLFAGRLVSAAVTLPPALGYQWDDNGAIAPQTPLNTRGPPATSDHPVVGNPAAGTFSLWQPGVAAPALYPLLSSGVASAPPEYVVAPNVYMWYSDFAAWSPDGRYLLTSGFEEARIAVPQLTQPSSSALTAAQVASIPVASARDAALSSIYGIMSAFESSVTPKPGVYPAPQSVAWQPDGRMAAAVPDVAGIVREIGGGIGAPPVTIYDSTTGNTTTTLQAQPNSDAATENSLTHQDIWLQWSPDGKHLLLLDNTIGTLTIWNPAALPKG